MQQAHRSLSPESGAPNPPAAENTAHLSISGHALVADCIPNYLHAAVMPAARFYQHKASCHRAALRGAAACLVSISQPHLLHGVLWGGQARRSTAARCIALWSWQTGGASWSPGSAAVPTPTLCWPARSQAAPGPSHPDPLTASHEAGGVGPLTGGAADSRIELGTASRCSGCMQRKAVLASQVESGRCHRDAAPRDGCDGIAPPLSLLAASSPGVIHGQAAEVGGARAQAALPRPGSGPATWGRRGGAATSTTTSRSLRPEPTTLAPPAYQWIAWRAFNAGAACGAAEVCGCTPAPRPPSPPHLLVLQCHASPDPCRRFTCAHHCQDSCFIYVP